MRTSRSSQLGVELLEDRAVPAVITVTGNGDTVAIDGVVTLREAIIAANTNAPAGDAPAGQPTGLDTIRFNLPAGQTSILLATELPAIVEGINIDGTTQPGFAGFPVVELNGANAGDASCFRLVNHDGSIIKGLVINRFSGQDGAIVIDADTGFTSGSHGIFGNVLGTDVSGMLDRGNFVGIRARGTGFNLIGGSGATSGNWVAGSTGGGIVLQSAGNFVEGNRIGIKRDGSGGLPNGAGLTVFITANNCSIGGYESGQGNVIAFNTNAGIRFLGTRNVDGATGVRIAGNSIFGNGGPGIDLVDQDNVIEPNDPNDADTGPNNIQNYPVITAASSNGLTTTISGVLESDNPNTPYRIDFFRSRAGTAAAPQGETFLGFLDVTTDANARVTFTATNLPGVPAGQVITTTATRSGFTGDTIFDTSEFSAPVLIKSSNPLLGPLLVFGPGNATGLLFTPTNSQYGNGSQVSLIPGFLGEIRVALADVNADGVLDIIAGTGPGGARVRVIDGSNGAPLADFTPFVGFMGGVFVAGGDLNGDGKAEVVVSGDGRDAFSGPVSNGLQVRVYSGSSMTNGTGSPALMADFNGLASLNGAAGEGENVKLGGRTAIADVNGDGKPDLLVAAGSGGGPRVCVWNGTGFAGANGGRPTSNPIANVFVFEASQRGGAFVTSGDVNGDGKAEIVVGGGPGGGPRVRIVDSAKLLTLPNLETVNLDDPVNLANGLVLNNFFAGSSTNRGGVRLTVRDVDGDGKADVVTGSGTHEQSQLRVYKATSLAAAFGTSGEPVNPQVIDPFSMVLLEGIWLG